MREVMGERLELVRDFVNTLDLEEKKDAVATPADLGSWLQVHGLLSETAVTADEHAAALAARETVRRLLLANNGEPADPADRLLRVLVAVSFVPATFALIDATCGTTCATAGVISATFAKTRTSRQTNGREQDQRGWSLNRRG